MADNTRTITIPLRRGFAETPRHKRTRKAVRVLKEHLAKHMKSDDVKLGKHLNEAVWANGIKNPPGKVTVTASKDDKGIVRAELVGHEYVDFKQQDKTQKGPKNLRDKLQSAVKETKAKKDDAKAEAPKADAKPAAPAKEVKEETTAKAEVKTETPKAEAPKADEKKTD